MFVNIIEQGDVSKVASNWLAYICHVDTSVKNRKHIMLYNNHLYFTTTTTITTILLLLIPNTAVSHLEIILTPPADELLRHEQILC